MDIHFVIGPPNSGKSTFVHENIGLQGLPWVDILAYQQDLPLRYNPTQKAILRTYARHRRDCIRMAERGKSFVVEHTLMKAKRRAYYIHRLKPYGRLVCWHTSVTGPFESARYAWELPRHAEGFDIILPITSIGWPDEWTL